MNFRILGVLCASLFTVPATSHATQIFNFTGNCSDCASAAALDSWDITIALEVGADYVLGSRLTADDFVSFTYAQSNLVSDPVSIDLSDWTDARSQVLQGVIAADGIMSSHFKLSLVKGSESLWSCTELGREVARSKAACKHTETVRFSVFADGTWRFGAPAKDVGDGATLDRAVYAVPEPMSLLLIGIALCGVGLSGKQRRI